MNNIPNILDIDGYCMELSKITGIDINSIRCIVLYNFASIYESDSNSISLSDALNNIERQIYNILNETQAKTAKTRTMVAI